MKRWRVSKKKMKRMKIAHAHTIHRIYRIIAILLVSVRPHPADTSRSFGNARGEFASVGKQIGRM